MSSTAIAESIVVLVMIYAARGLVFACAFLGAGMRRLDSTAEGSSFSFRALILPGTVALPLLALRWARGACRPIEHHAHRDAARLGESG